MWKFEVSWTFPQPFVCDVPGFHSISPTLKVRMWTVREENSHTTRNHNQMNYLYSYRLFSLSHSLSILFGSSYAKNVASPPTRCCFCWAVCQLLNLFIRSVLLGSATRGYKLLSDESESRKITRVDSRWYSMWEGKWGTNFFVCERVSTWSTLLLA